MKQKKPRISLIPCNLNDLEQVKKYHLAFLNLYKDIIEEQHLQMCVVDYLNCLFLAKKQGNLKYFFSIPNEQKCSFTRGKQLNSMGRKSGVADILLIFDDKIVFLELKSPKVKIVLRDKQKDFKEIIEDVKIAEYYVLNGYLEVVKLINGIKGKEYD